MHDHRCHRAHGADAAAGRKYSELRGVCGRAGSSGRSDNGRTTVDRTGDSGFAQTDASRTGTGSVRTPLSWEVAGCHVRAFIRGWRSARRDTGGTDGRRLDACRRVRQSPQNDRHASSDDRLMADKRRRCQRLWRILGNSRTGFLVQNMSRVKLGVAEIDFHENPAHRGFTGFLLFASVYGPETWVTGVRRHG